MGEERIGSSASLDLDLGEKRVSRVCHYTARELDGGGAPKQGMGPFSLATDRSIVYLLVATDGLTVNINIYSDRHSLSYL
jgi:hypothetical protein